MLKLEHFFLPRYDLGLVTFECIEDYLFERYFPEHVDLYDVHEVTHSCCKQLRILPTGLGLSQCQFKIDFTPI